MRLPAGGRIGIAPGIIASLLASPWLASCSSAEPPIAVTAVSPAQAFNDAEIPVVIAGGPFRPAYDIDTSGGQALTQRGAFSGVLAPSSGAGPSFAVDDLTWLSPSELAAEIPMQIPSGLYDLRVRDPRGIVGVLPGAYTSLGPDHAAPAIEVIEPGPGAVVEVGAEVPVAWAADDGLGSLASMSWTVSDAGGSLQKGTCAIDADVSRETCRFLFNAPNAKQAEPVTIHVVAVDGAGNAGAADSTVLVALPPVVDDVAPRVGPEGGGTTLVVTGADLVASAELLVDGVAVAPAAGGGSAARFEVTAPPHAPGVVPLAVRSGDVEVDAGTFEYVGKPVVLAVSPTTGPSSGNVPVVIAGRNFRTDFTTITIGLDDGPRLALGCAYVENENRITGLLPPGAGVVSIFAHDPVGGDSELQLAFTYVDTGDLDAGADADLDGATCLKMGSER